VWYCDILFTGSGQPPKREKPIANLTELLIIKVREEELQKMETKYGKYIITGMKPDVNLPSWRLERKPTDASTRLLWLDDDVIKGAFYVECVWYWKGSEQSIVEAHTHPFDEVITFFGSNPEDPQDLCGEVELWLDGEKHILTKSSLIFVPKGLKHCPLIIRRVDRPIFHFTTGPGGKYS
jgi:hypothetical protein